MANYIKALKYSIWTPIKDRLKLLRLKNQINTMFPESHLSPENIFPVDVIESIGKETYGFFKAIFFDDVDECKIRIGSFCSIGQETTFILGGEHVLNRLSTYPFDKRILGQKIPDSRKKGNIWVDDDVWIGYGATIMSGVHIGQGAVIGAKSVVTKDVPPYAIYAGNRIIRYRFSDETIRKLMGIDFQKLTREEIAVYSEKLSMPIKEEWFEENQLYNLLTGEELR